MVWNQAVDGADTLGGRVENKADEDTVDQVSSQPWGCPHSGLSQKDTQESPLPASQSVGCSVTVSKDILARAST